MQLVYREDLRRALALGYLAGVDRSTLTDFLFVIVRTILREAIPHRTIPWCRSPALLRVEAVRHIIHRRVVKGRGTWTSRGSILAHSPWEIICSC